MQFAKAHKVSTYAVILSAFLAVAVSGLLNPLVVLLAGMAIIGSWYWEAPRVNFDRWSLAWTSFAALVFVYELVSVVAGSEILLAGAEFLVTLLVTKLYNRRGSKDYLHIYLLSFLLLTSGTVLNAEVTYGFFFLCYVVSFTWALIIFQLRRELENNFLLRHSAHSSGAGSPEEVRVQRVLNSRRIVGKKFFLGTSLVSLAVFASAVSLFLLFPRIGFGFFFEQGRSPVTMAGFHDGVELGGHGLIKKDRTVVMRVNVDKAYAGRSAPSIHWRGVAFDEYSQGKWGRGETVPATNHTSYPRGSTSEHYLLYDRSRVPSAELEARKQRASKQVIYLEPLGNSVLFGGSMPLVFEMDNKHNTRTRAGDNDELRQHHDAGLRYVVYSDLEPPPRDVLRAASGPLPEGYDSYLQLPPEIPQCASPAPRPAGPIDTRKVRAECRVRDLARWITRDAKTNYDKARALEKWLQTELGYTLEMKSPGGMEPVEFFLFERQKGHCEYFSSAMAIMARSIGIPTRNVNGFLGGEWNEIDDFLMVRAGDAHSWVEVYFPGQGWVTFDPTPPGESDLLGRGSSGLMDRLRQIADTVRFTWFKWVIEYDLYAQLSLFRSFGKSLKSGANTYFKEPIRRAVAWAKRHRAVAGLLFGAVALLIIGISYWRRRAETDRSLAPRATARRRDPTVRSYLSALRTLAKRGYRRDEAVTPREFAETLAEKRVPGAESLQELTELYYRAEYAGVPPKGEHERAATLASTIAEELRAAKRAR